MKIRKAEEKDRKKILELLNSEPTNNLEGEQPYNDECAEEYIKGKSFETFVAEIGGKVAGVTIAHVRRIGKYAELYHTIVDKKYRRKGIGEKLYKFRENHLKKLGIVYVFLFTTLDNMAMQKLAEKSGYKKGKKFFAYSKVLIKKK